MAVWLMMTPRRRAPVDDGAADRGGEGHEFTRTHYDAGTEYPLESAATRVPGESPAADPVPLPDLWRNDSMTATGKPIETPQNG